MTGLLPLLIAACGGSKTPTSTTSAGIPGPSGDGYTSLFDGNTLNGWRTYQNKPADSWMVKDSALYCAGSTTDKSDRRADLITTGQYENFDLTLDWKIAPKGNSGVMYLVTEDSSAAYLTGPEYQIIDDENFPEKLEDWQKTGSNYAMHTAPAARPNPPGQWNHTRIVVNKGHVEHWLNGEKVVDYQLGDEDWQKRKAAGKLKDAASSGLAKKGHIALQDHGSEAWFKNIKIKEL